VVPPTEPCALRATQPLKVSTRDLSWGKGGRCVWLTTYHPCSADTSRKSGVLIYPEPLGPPRPVAEELYFTRLLLVGATLLCSCIQTENIKHFEELVVSDWTVRMVSAWVVATPDSRRNFAHAHVSHSLTGIISWTVDNTRIYCSALNGDFVIPTVPQNWDRSL